MSAILVTRENHSVGEDVTFTVIGNDITYRYLNETRGGESYR